MELGVLLSMDEAYDLLMSFGYVAEDGKTNAAKPGLRVNPHQSAMNKLFQYGQSSRVLQMFLAA